MSNVIEFKKRNLKPDNSASDSAFMCPTCETCLWHLREDYKCECQNGHVFDYFVWDILEIKK